MMLCRLIWWRHCDVGPNFSYMELPLCHLERSEGSKKHVGVMCYAQNDNEMNGYINLRAGIL